MEYIGLVIIVALFIIWAVKGIDKKLGPIGCVVVFLLLFVWMCAGIEKEMDEEKARQERLDKAVDEIRKDKEDYNRRHNIPNKNYND